MLIKDIYLTFCLIFCLSVLCYLALFRLEELGVGYFRKLVASQDINKMFKFLNFFLSEENIKTWMADEVLVNDE